MNLFLSWHLRYSKPHRIFEGDRWHSPLLLPLGLTPEALRGDPQNPMSDTPSDGQSPVESRRNGKN